MTRLSLSSRSHSRKRDRYRSISTLDRSADSFRNNGRINSPEARDRSYRDRSEIEVEQRQKKEEGETNPEPILFFLPLEEMLNFTVKFNESMDRFGWKTGGWVSRKQPPTNFFFVPQRRGYPNRSLFTIFRGILAFQAFSRSFVRAGRLPRDTWPPPDLPRFTPLAELKATEKIKGENRRNLLAVQFLRDRGLKIRLDPSPSFSSPSPSILVFSTVFRSLSSARFAVSFLEADDSIPPSR